MSTRDDQPAHLDPVVEAVSGRVASLFDAHGRFVLGLCRAFLRDPVEAEDAAQQTFLSVQRALVNGSVPREPQAWLAAIARNECLHRVRSRVRNPLPGADEAEEAGPDAHMAAVCREEIALLRDALADLPAQQREAILLRELRGFSYDEVAASLDVSTSAVTSLIFRARRRLQLRLGETAAALSPAAWFLPLRGFIAGLGESGVAAPVAVKAVTLGVGTVVLASGPRVTPQVIGLGHAPVPVRAVAALTDTRPTHHRSVAQSGKTPSAASSAPPAVVTLPPKRSAHAADLRARPKRPLVSRPPADRADTANAPQSPASPNTSEPSAAGAVSAPADAQAPVPASQPAGPQGTDQAASGSTGDGSSGEGSNQWGSGSDRNSSGSDRSGSGSDRNGGGEQRGTARG
jgi:RNA polymerase sigma factor (sigma-70 family)